MSVAHIQPVPGNELWPGLATARIEAAARVLASRGHTVVPVPADGRPHPYARTCPLCTPPEAVGA